ncbi:hypothetical protein GCU67_15455, partial [Modestobacter muralis]|nr:hypothetical protein [Modestobacter muralis]NEN52439.1 hypothetical protein [Modestobacter muralis]
MSGTQHVGPAPDEAPPADGAAPLPPAPDAQPTPGELWDEAWLPRWAHPAAVDGAPVGGADVPVAVDVPVSPPEAPLLAAWEVEAAAIAALIAELDNEAEAPLAVTPPYVT